MTGALKLLKKVVSARELRDVRDRLPPWPVNKTGKGNDLNYVTIGVRDKGATVESFVAACGRCPRPWPQGADRIVAEAQAWLEADLGAQPVVICNSGKSGCWKRPHDHFNGRGGKLFGMRAREASAVVRPLGVMPSSRARPT